MSDAEKYYQTPPILYDIESTKPIAADKQWMIPLTGSHDKPIEVSLNATEMTKVLGENSWVSPTINYQSPTNKLYVYIDYAGKESYGSGQSEIYSLPVCIPLSKYLHCPIERLALKNSYDHHEIYNVATFNNDHTFYEPNHSGNTSIFYGYTKPNVYEVDSPRNLAIIVNTFLQDHYQLRWMRLTINDHPITLKKISFFLTSKYQIYFKLLLILLPCLIIYNYYSLKGFSSPQALVTGGFLTLFASLHTLIWDLNYMVVGSLIIAFSGVFYIFANSLYKIIYGIGFIIILFFSQQYYEGLNKNVFMQTGLLAIIGIALFIKEPD
ncbi:hypothetical protein [Alkanindiges illinoisensis]|uniref:Uncharacterized protein n=1 Tax=Alkanindiges illinoisensis TaxID=197183 RepID=A0A4Y7XD54_9GAMM|nr:hypothetical protein [Alkanindiges illinoisensis]TEU28592.1 hypothetical protein E2B99_05630 [Alkanindiges illinoisensis]